MRKSPWLAALATTLILSVATPASAAVNVNLNGAPLTFDVPPVVDNGRTLVPVRAIFEALGARITWDPTTQTVSAVHPERDKYVILVLGSTTAWVDGVEITLDVAPKSIDGRTMVPLRFISTAMGAEVTWDPTTETAFITQVPLEQPAEEPGTEEPGAQEPADGQTDSLALSRYTRAIAYTHLEETMLCTWGTDGRMEDFAYLFTNDDPEYFGDAMRYLGETTLCWELYAENFLATLPAPAGAEAAHAELQKWVALHQNALRQLGEASRAHTKGALTERDRLFTEAKQVYAAAVAQEQVMLAAMNAITSNETQFMTVAEHQYFAWLDEMMGATDNCYSQLNMIGTGYMEKSDAFWAQGAAECWAELPTTLKEQTPPTPRLQALLETVLAELTKHTPNFNALAAQLQTESLTGEALEAAVDEVWSPWVDSLSTLEAQFVYRTYGAE